MADSTSRLGLYLPGGGSSGLNTPDEVVDIDKINDNMRLIDTGMGALPTTSSTRPAEPFDGQLVYETDTRNLRIWLADKSVWELVNVHVGVSEPEGKQAGDLWRDISE